MNTTTEIAVIPQASEDDVDKLDAIASAVHSQYMGAPTEIRKAIIAAKGIKQIRDALKPMMDDILELQNTPLGFRTDRKEGYKSQECIEVVALALVRGLRLTGNEFNIIAGNLYVTKEGFQRLIAEFEGLTNLKVDIGVPAAAGEGCLVECRARWKLLGVDDMLECTKGDDGDFRIPVRKNAGMGMDAIQGKAKSKLLRRVYERLTGSKLVSDADADDGMVMDAAEVKHISSDPDAQPESMFDEQGYPVSTTSPEDE